MSQVVVNKLTQRYAVLSDQYDQILARQREIKQCDDSTICIRCRVKYENTEMPIQCACYNDVRALLGEMNSILAQMHQLRGDEPVA